MGDATLKKKKKLQHTSKPSIKKQRTFPQLVTLSSQSEKGHFRANSSFSISRQLNDVINEVMTHVSAAVSGKRR